MKNPYKIAVSGNGDTAVFCYGLGNLLQNTLSDRFKKHFKVYSSDLYWDEKHELQEPGKLTLSHIIEDLQKIITNLGLKRYILCAHSAFGIIALEAAKHDERIAGVIMIGSPPDWNKNTWSQSKKYFDLHASSERKANYQKRLKHYEKVKVPGENECSINAYLRDTPRYWKDFTLSDSYLTSIWGDTVASNQMMNHLFETILPHHNHAKGIEKVKCPVLLVGGPYDFDCLPLELWKKASKPKNFTVIECTKSGHWPHLEEPDLFDQGVIDWINASFQ